MNRFACRLLSLLPLGEGESPRPTEGTRSNRGSACSKTGARESTRQGQFAYLADPICIASLLIYVLNRWYLKPHHIGGWFTHGYLNDELCLPLFLPMILRAQQMLGLRRHDDYPRLWEVLQHWLIFSIVFEVIIPRFPSRFDSTADPFDALAYLAGGLLAWIWWRWRRSVARVREGMVG